MIRKLLFLPAFASLLSCSLILNKMPADADDEGDVDTDTDADAEADDGTEGEAECGNAAVENGEECDDGNDVAGDGCESDCTFTCTGDADCRDESTCNGEETCNTASHTCEPGTAQADGFVCAADPRSICLDGACEVSICGDGFVDTGGGEFCEPPAEADCNAECILMCEDNEDCPDDGEICNGLEECLLETGECTHVYGLDDGAECGEDPRRICIAQTCQNSICGDGYADEGLVPAEECDDMNTTAGDGCENDCTFTCRINSDCDDGLICTDDRCNITEHTCAAFIAGPGAVCRPAAEGMPCDVEETCDGDNSDCPPDAFLGSSVVCRAAAGACDVAESCDGTGPQCPDDAFRPDTFECRASSSVCDPAEFCTGSSATCPADTVNCGCTGDVDCPDDGNLCNGEEYCNLGTWSCSRRNIPANGTVCDDSPRMICLDEICRDSVCGDGFADTVIGEDCDDGNGVEGDGCDSDCTWSCTSSSDCNDGHACTADTCNISTHVCSNSPLPSTTVCRPATLPCDAAERCTGTSLDCPADAFLPYGSECGGPGTLCTGVAVCTGLSPECPEPPVICWNSVDLGAAHTCGIKEDLTLFCWGSNGSGQLGNGTTTRSLVPVKVSIDAPWSEVAAGGGHSCAIDMGSKLFCWGANSSGQVGDGTNLQKTVPTEVSGGIEVGWSSVCAGHLHSCGISEGMPYCWGDNGSGRLGIGITGGTYSTPQPVDTSGIGVADGWIQISCGDQHTCALTAEGEIFCWGANGSGQLGDNTNMSRNRPTRVYDSGESEPWTMASCGKNHTCGVRGVSPFCWGENGNSQIGDGTTLDRDVPTSPLFTSYTPGLMLSVAAGGAHSCVTDDTGDGYCWGANWYGQLGIGSTSLRSTPAKINYVNWRTIVAGENHTCATKLYPLYLWCWGLNSNGQVGDGTNINKTNPVQVF